MTDATMIKGWATRSGADLCGIAGLDRFERAPAGFHPRDILPEARSVIAFARRVPDTVFRIASKVPYTHTEAVVLAEVERIALALVRDLEEAGHLAVPVPSEPYEAWDAESRTGRGILSLKHAAHLAGLGAITRNHLLTNRRFGNRLKLGAVLTDAPLEADPVDLEPRCPARCDLCRAGCPSQAIQDDTVIQKRCRSLSGVNAKGYFIYGCHACRSRCPHSKGATTALSGTASHS